jgi:hypothetical protein
MRFVRFKSEPRNLLYAEHIHIKFAACGFTRVKLAQASGGGVARICEKREALLLPLFV